MNTIDVEQTGEGERVLPFYIVCDESASMAYNGGINAINKALPELHESVASNPLVNDKARIGLISFSDDAEVLLQVSALADVEDMPGVMEKGATSYGSAFRLLKKQIKEDIATLRADGFRVQRPAVFFISDGEPTDSDWQTYHAELIDKNSNPHAPNIIAFGVDSADPDTIRRVATVRGFIAETGIDPATALTEIIGSLTDTIVASSSSATPQLHVGPPPPGVIDVDLDEVFDDDEEDEDEQG